VRKATAQRVQEILDRGSASLEVAAWLGDFFEREYERVEGEVSKRIEAGTLTPEESRFWWLEMDAMRRLAKRIEGSARAAQAIREQVEEREMAKRSREAAVRRSPIDGVESVGRMR
jgi:hypothetical protein